MPQMLSVRLNPETESRLEALAKRSKRPKSHLAAEAIEAYLQAEEAQLEEIRQGIDDLDSGRFAGHRQVARWLRSWGSADETKPPRA